MATKLTPLHDRIVVRREAETGTTAGGIIIPDTAKEKQQMGIVVSAGPGKVNDRGERVPLDVKVGDKVLFGKYAGSETPRTYLEHEGEDLIIMREEEIWAVVSGDPVKHGEPVKAGAARK